jgi:DNA polymerase-1
VYPHWLQLKSRAGRMACADPNLQQLPREKAYRRCVVAPEGRVLVKADYSQIELRISALVAGERKMVEAFARGDDLVLAVALVAWIGEMEGVATIPTLVIPEQDERQHYPAAYRRDGEGSPYRRGRGGRPR